MESIPRSPETFRSAIYSVKEFIRLSVQPIDRGPWDSLSEDQVLWARVEYTKPAVKNTPATQQPIVDRAAATTNKKNLLVRVYKNRGRHYADLYWVTPGETISSQPDEKLQGVSRFEQQIARLSVNSLYATEEEINDQKKLLLVTIPPPESA